MYRLPFELGTIGPLVFAEKSHAVMDTGSSCITGPKKAINTIVRNTRAKLLGKLWVVNCYDDVLDKLPTMEFTFEGADGAKPGVFILEGRDYIYQMKGMCILAISENMNDHDDNFYIGTVFMRKYFTAFNHKEAKVGIAVAVN